jgi:NAD(P)-dependent dehydrogenase (short-subunit alcohol dehydrogenase family)
VSGADLAGKRIVVTGGAGGLGRAFVVELAAQGASVLAVDVRDDELAETCALAQAGGGQVLAATADVTSAASLRAVAATAREVLGGLEGLVNNAAVVAGLTRRPFDEITEDEWDRVLAVNAKGVWLAARAFVPLLREGGGGAIVNLASEAAFSGSPGLAHYVASKAAVVGLTRVLARELGPEGIRVNALAPGFIPTEGSISMVAGQGYDAGATPLGRVGEPSDLLGALCFLLSDASAFVAGQCLLVNGGRLLA